MFCRTPKQAVAIRTALVAALLMTVGLGSGLAAGKPNWAKEMSKIRSAKWDADPAKRTSIVVEKLLGIATDEAVPDVYRRLAYHQAFQVRVGNVSALDDVDTAMDICRQYATLKGGRVFDYDLIFARNRFEAHLARLKLANSQEALANTLEAVDDYEQLAKATPHVNHAPSLGHCYRAMAYLCAHMPDKADEEYELFANTHDRTDPQWYKDIAVGFKSEGRPIKGLLVAADGLSRCQGNNRIGLILGAYSEIAEGTKLDEEALGEILPRVAACDNALKLILMKASRERFLGGDVDGALAYAKLTFDVAPVNELKEVIEWLGQCLRARSMDPRQANAFINYLTLGPAGRDGKLGTNDDCANPLADIDSPLTPRTIAQIREGVKGAIIPPNDIYGSLKNISVALVLIGAYDDALSVSRGAYGCAPIKDMREASAIIPRVLKARSGTLVQVNAYLMYQQHGPKGPDGEDGTADDMDDPLGATGTPLPQYIRDQLAAIAESRGATADTCSLRGTARLALGQLKSGFAQMRMAYAMAGTDERTLAAAVQNIAAAVKAIDGHVKRANQYLLYQSYGAAGPDGRLGTKDDLGDPMPQILADVQKLP